MHMPTITAITTPIMTAVLSRELFEEQELKEYEFLREYDPTIYFYPVVLEEDEQNEPLIHAD